MYHKHHTKGIILSGRGEGDRSRRIQIFTENFGLLSAKVQGARISSSKLQGGSQDFAFGEFSLVHGKSGWKIVSTRIEKNVFENLRNNPKKITTVANVFNLVRKLTGEGEHNSSLFQIVQNFIEFLEKAEDIHVALGECLVLLRILHSLGYMREDPEIAVPLTTSQINIEDLAIIAPRRAKVVELINESLKATHLT